MKIPSPLTDDDFINLVTPESHYSTTMEVLGHHTSLSNRLHAALDRGQNQVTSEVLGILAEIHAFSITASRGYLFR